ncbi:MAG: sulfatase [Planctomycetota bacterium]
MPNQSPQPNILMIFTDDHAASAISAYGSRLIRTPNLDRLAEEGARLDATFCTNAICGPSRACVMTGTYNHVNGVTTLSTHLDNRQPTFARELRSAGYQTALFGKWHLGHGPEHDPVDFDEWAVLPGQGDYFDPAFLTPTGEHRETGYVTDLLTDRCVNWLEQRDADHPFLLMCHHKAPHRPWEPAPRHRHAFDDAEFPEPISFDDDYAGRPAAAAARMRIDRDFKPRDLKLEPPSGLDPAAYKRWAYRRYLQDYLGCVLSVDESVGRLLDTLDAQGIADNTLVVYSSDQGFFLGEHGWFDKRFMYDESFRMPMLVRYPAAIRPGHTTSAIASNVDFAPTFLDYAGLPIPEHYQGYSLRPILEGDAPANWQDVAYHRYWMHQDIPHNVCAHYGIRTDSHKLIYYYGHPLDQAGANGPPTEPYWELYDLNADPYELNNLYGQPGTESLTEYLRQRLSALQQRIGDKPFEHDPAAQAVTV